MLGAVSWCFAVSLLPAPLSQHQIHPEAEHPEKRWVPSSPIASHGRRALGRSGEAEAELGSCVTAAARCLLGLARLGCRIRDQKKHESSWDQRGNVRAVQRGCTWEEGDFFLKLLKVGRSGWWCFVSSSFLSYRLSCYISGAWSIDEALKYLLTKLEGHRNSPWETGMFLSAGAPPRHSLPPGMSRSLLQEGVKKS